MMMSARGLLHCDCERKMNVACWREKRKMSFGMNGSFHVSHFVLTCSSYLRLLGARVIDILVYKRATGDESLVTLKLGLARLKL